MTDVGKDGPDPRLPQRKRLRVGVGPERGAVNAVRTFLERHRFVVQEWDTRNDYGRDLIIDLTEDDELTGTLLAAQVKGGRSQFLHGVATVTARPSDIRFWSESTVPVVGIVWHPDDESMWWVDLTSRSAELMDELRDDPTRLETVQHIAATHPLDDRSVHRMVEAVRRSAPGYAEDAFLKLFDEDDVVRRDGVMACWSFSRRDSRALTLLRGALPRLRGQSFLDALSVIGMLAGNPDVYHPSVAPRARAFVDQLIWGAEEVQDLVHEHELLTADDDAWRRGGTGQVLWHVLRPYGRDAAPFADALEVAVRRERFDTAVRLLVCLLSVADEPRDVLADILEAYPSLDSRWDVRVVAEHIDEWGFIEPYE